MARVTVGRVRGHRGNAGEITVDIHPEDAELWLTLESVRIGESSHRVESSRAYRDKLVLKLVGCDDAGAAAALRGASVSVDRDQLELEPEDWLNDDLVGLTVFEGDRRLGQVRAILPTAAADLLEVERSGGGEPLLIPLVEPIVRQVDLEARRVEVRLPEGLLELNA